MTKEEQESTPKRQPTNAQHSQLQIVEQSRVGSCHIKWFAHVLRWNKKLTVMLDVLEY